MADVVDYLDKIEDPAAKARAIAKRVHARAEYGGGEPPWAAVRFHLRCAAEIIARMPSAASQASAYVQARDELAALMGDATRDVGARPATTKAWEGENAAALRRGLAMLVRDQFGVQRCTVTPTLDDLHFVRDLSATAGDLVALVCAVEAKYGVPWPGPGCPKTFGDLMRGVETALTEAAGAAS